MLAYRYHSIEPEGLWTSDPFPPAERRHIVQGVIGGWLGGHPRWATDLEGAFIYGLDAKGKEMKSAPRSHATRRGAGKAASASPPAEEGMRVAVTAVGAKKHGVREGAHGFILRVASADARKGPARSRARVLVSIHGTEFSTGWPTSSLRIPSRHETDPFGEPNPSSYLGGLAYKAGMRGHATKSQRGMMDEASRRIAEGNETFLEMLPTMRRKDLERLVAKRPALWGRFAGYLTSGHVFVDDPVAGRQHAAKKSPAQLDREIVEVVGPSGGTWKKSDRPINSEHIDIGHAGARVQPLYYGGANYYEWSIWLGPSGRRVLHDSGTVRTKAAAKRAAERELAALRGTAS